MPFIEYRSILETSSPPASSVYQDDTQWWRGRWFSGVILRGPVVFLDLGEPRPIVMNLFCQSNQAQKCLEIHNYKSNITTERNYRSYTNGCTISQSY